MHEGVHEPIIYISYAWGSESEVIAMAIEKQFQKRGLPIVRDKNILGYKGRIKAFMKQLSRAQYIILVISNKYLHSVNCMFEMVQIFKNQSFYERIFPIVLDEVNIYDPSERVRLMRFWENETETLSDEIKQLKDLTNIQGLTDDLNLTSEIRDNIARLTNILKDTNTLSVEQLVDSGFEPVYQAVREKVEADTGKKTLLAEEKESPEYSGSDHQNIFVRIKAKLFGTTAFFEVANRNRRRVISFGITAVLGICAFFLALPYLSQNASDQTVSEVETPVTLKDSLSIKSEKDSISTVKTAGSEKEKGTFAQPNTRYNVELFVPSNLTKATVFVDGKPAEIVDRSLVSITVRVRKKDTSHHFEITEGGDSCFTDKLISKDNLKLTLCD